MTRNTMKILSLKLVNISYEGSSIGDDIRIEIEALGTFFALNKKLPKGRTADIQKEIVQIPALALPPVIPVSIRRIVERDPVFNDSGNIDISLPVPKGRQPTQTFYRINVREWRGAFRKTAVFTVTLEMEIHPATKYVLEGKNGWTKVKPEDGNKTFSLPTHTKVSLLKTDDREHFTVMEGPERGRKASVEFQEDESSFLGDKNEHREPTRLAYSVSKKTLRFGRETYAAVDYPDEPWTPGIHDIELPDYPHPGGRPYLDRAPHALTWFRAGHDGERYIHTGGRSAGCITLTEHGRWEKLYQVLIRARKGDGISAGILHVIA